MSKNVIISVKGTQTAANQDTNILELVLTAANPSPKGQLWI